MTTREELSTYKLIFGIFFGVVPIAGALIVATVKLGPAVIPIWMSLAGVTWMISRGSIGDAISAHLRGDAGAAELSQGALAELDELRAQVAELQERQDFTERLVAQQREGRALSAGEHS